MNPDTTYTRTLLRALKAVGSETKLAEALRTSPELLRQWISGELKPPSKVYFAALDIATRSVQKPAPKAQ
jgi:DNA-binding transcriptional regulator YdaS (Cro superfamily)